ncbi:MAG: SurA N-terminal domain-containing protein [Elusimicrobia bacterium]|nr:SurA N-terminal domain-containing protein [Elusimicrobiota bacterium]
MILSSLRRHRKSLFVGMVAIFLIGIFVGLGGYLFTSADTSEAVAVVGPTKIPYMRFQVRANQYLDVLRNRGTDVTDALASEVRQGMLRDMIVDEILSQEAEKLGMRVTDMELAASIRSNPSFQREGAFDSVLYLTALRQVLRSSPEEYEREQRKTMLAAKLKQLLFQSAKLLPGEVADEYRRQKGSMKEFEKNQAALAQELERARALDIINFYLRQISGQMDVRSFLPERERGT